MTGAGLGDGGIGGPPPPEDLGSVGQEALKLLRALGAQQGASTSADTTTETAGGSEHTCPNAWCPVCTVVGLVRDNPEAVAQVSESAVAMMRALRDLYDAAVNPKDHLS